MSQLHLMRGSRQSGTIAESQSGSDDSLKWIAGMAVFSAVVIVTAFVSLGVFTIPSTQGIPSVVLGSVSRNTLRLN